MKTVELKTVDGRVRYYLADDTGAPVPPVLKYLKFKDNAGYARNTLRMHCIHLKHFFTYLGEAGKDYERVNIDDLAEFLAWLKNPDILKKVVPLRFEPEHQPQTINTMIDTAVMFYDYLLRHEGMENQLSEKLVKFVRDPGRNYRSFLHGIAENRMIKSHILKLPVPRMQLRTISREDAVRLLDSCTNLRDYLLLYLLFETGMRIGEALSLWLEDFDMAGLTITLHDRGEMENLAEIKTVYSPRRLDCTQELMNLFTGYICEHHTAEIHTNHVFLKLRGGMAGKAMDYRDVDNLFRTLRKKTGIRVTPHMFRHTSLSLLYSAGWEPEMLKQRAGHKNIYTTLDTYVHPSQEEVAEAFRKASESLKIPSVGKGVWSVMRTAVLAQYGAFDDKYSRMTEYLLSEGGYWKNNDRWYMDADSFMEAGIPVSNPRHWLLADFGSYKKWRLKEEIKYFLLSSMKDGTIEAVSVYRNYRQAISNIGKLLSSIKGVESFNRLDTCDRELEDVALSGTERCAYLYLKHGVTRQITDYYDDRGEMEKDIWHAARIPGTKVSATGKRQKLSISFERIPLYYREMVKRFMRRLVIKRSWSYCAEMMMYIRYFLEVFYAHGYTEGFLERLARPDIEKYLGWVASDYEGKNATFRSKAVSFIRQYIDYIQLAEYPQAPQKDVNRLIFADDIPKRERPADTMGKVKYVPEPVRMQLDACISEIEPADMMPVYILLRESGWRGTDVLNLRYDSCLEHLWNDHEKEYIPYLCGEITKTGIPLLKIPIQKEVADMVKKLADDAAEHSTDENNPDKYLFNTYEGRCKGLPLSKPAFSAAVRELIDRKGILDGDGNPYHFKAHALRHTRALEYTEQGMPIGIIQQILGHCSLQMTLHYSKVSENMLYRKWKETEKLNLLHLDSTPPNAYKEKQEEIRYEFIRKNLDAVRVPFGVCFKPTKLPCRQQISQCLDCANFCTSRDNIPEYEKEIERVREQIKISKTLGRDEWEEKNRNYLGILENMLARIRQEGLIHKNGSHREEYDG